MEDVEMSVNVVEAVESHLTEIEGKKREWEEAKNKLELIEAELASMCNGDGKEKPKRGRPSKGKRGRPKNVEGKVNKAATIREYHEKHPDARPKDIIKALGEKGVMVQPAAVWQALNKEPKEPKADGRGRRAKGSTLADTVIKILQEEKGGLELQVIVAKVIASGYKTKSTGSTFTAACQNCLIKLRQKNMVIKDEEAKKYKVA